MNGTPDDLHRGEPEPEQEQDRSSAPINPFDDLERMKRKPDTSMNVGRRVLVAVPVRKSGRSEFFRVCPDPAYSIDAWILELDDGARSVTYFVDPAVVELAGDDARPVRIVTCVNVRGAVFLETLKMPYAGSGNRYAESALEIAEVAKQIWLKRRGDRDSGAYEYIPAEGEIPEPKWPDQPFAELLRLAFKGGRIIDSYDHPALRELRGEL
jgi:hypothetical protein